MTNSGAKEQLFYEAPRGTRITSIKSTDIEKMNWFTWTGVLGLVCEGIWPPATDITDVNSTDLTKDKKILATGDDFGLVKLFDFPVKVCPSNLSLSIDLSLCTQGKFAKFKRYTGHSAHVTRVRWTFDNTYLISIGGRDVATLVWKHERNTNDVVAAPTSEKKANAKGVNASPTAAAAAAVGVRREQGQSDDSDNTDSEEEGYDSDVQHDRSMDYNARILIDPGRLRNEKKDTPRPSATVSAQKPMSDDSLLSETTCNDSCFISAGRKSSHRRRK